MPAGGRRRRRRRIGADPRRFGTSLGGLRAAVHPARVVTIARIRSANRCLRLPLVGYTEINFAAFGMIGMRFCPRIRSLHRQRIYCADPARDHGVLEPVLQRGRRAVNFRLIAEQWDRIGQFYAAFPAGHATASAALQRLNRFQASNRFYAANRELGRALKTEFVLQYMSEPKLRAKGQAVKTVAYLRVSTPLQDVRSQRLAILEYARANDVRIDEFIEATASGQASEKRRRLDELTGLLQRGDCLVVSELSRLGRSLGQIVTILDALAKAGVAFVALKENIRVEGRRDIQSKVMTTLFALFAEIERDLISERTREGLARAKASGRKLGRPKGSLGVSRLDGKEDEIRRFLELGVSKTAIAKITGVSRTALYSFMSTRGLRPSP